MKFKQHSFTKIVGVNMYLAIGFIISFVSIFLLNSIGTRISRTQDEKRVIIWSVICSIIYGLLIAYFRWAGGVGVYGPTPFFGWIILGAVISMFIAVISTDEWLGAIPGTVVVVILLIWSFSAWFFYSSSAYNWEAKVALAGKVEVIQNDQTAIEPADVAHICLVTEKMAKLSANNALSKIKLPDGVFVGSRYEVDDPTKQFSDGQLWWIFPLEFGNYFKWKANPVSPGYLRVSAEDPLAEPQAVQANKQGKPFQMKYLTSSFRENFAERYLRDRGYNDKILKDFTFEVDDDWNPYLTVSVLSRTIGYSGLKTDGIILLDVQTGDIKFYKVDEKPAWVDRVIPLEIINENLSSWGTYANAPSWWYTFWNSDRSQKMTDGQYLAYGRDGQCEWFSGFTSTNSEDFAIIGFSLTNASTGKTKYFKTTGITEKKAEETSKTLWSNFSDYESTEFMVYNIYGYLTYVIPVESKGQFKGLTLVSLGNYNINAKGLTLSEALSAYRGAIYNASKGRVSPNSGELPFLELTSIIKQVGIPMQMGQYQIFSFTLVGEAKIFQVSYNADQPEVPFMREGKQVRITFQDTKEKIITCSSFHLSDFTLSDSNPNQARLIKNQAIVEKEVKRVEKQNK